jgi:hypothetical protein
LMLQSCRKMDLSMHPAKPHPVANLPKCPNLSNDLLQCSLCSLD